MGATRSEASLADVLVALDRRYPPATAEPWDAVGLVCGDPRRPVARVLFAVDPVAVVVDEAIAAEVDLVVVHHPLFLSGVHGVGADAPGGAVVHRLIRADIGLVAVHTNADVARPGVSDALADLIGLVDTEPLLPATVDATGDAAAKAQTGLGRIGTLPVGTDVAGLADLLAERLPPTAHGIRVLGEPGRPVHRVAVCGGSGDGLLGIATAAGADAYITSDIKHHRALDHRAAGGCAVLDIAHWAGEWPWLPMAARLLAADLQADGASVECLVSTQSTDPWTDHVEARGEG